MNEAPSSKAPLHMIQNYGRDVFTLLKTPSAFFKQMPVTGGLSRPLAFALVNHWLGSALAFFWAETSDPARGILGGLARWFQSFISQHFGKDNDLSFLPMAQEGKSWFQSRDQWLNWYSGMESVLIDPFFTLASILFSSVFVFIGARLLVSPPRAGHLQEVTYESTVRILCFGLTPSLLLGIPYLGGVLSSFFCVIFTLIGAREVYRVTSTRALFIVLFPKLIFFGIIGLGLVIIALIAFKMLMWF